jgi:hypothetical protein
MRRRPLSLLPFLLLASLLLRAQNTTTPAKKLDGNLPRDSAEKYPAHADRDTFSLGAELLLKKDVTSTFHSDLNHCCLVVLVAVYPKNNAAMVLSFADFTLVEVKTNAPTRSESPAVVAAKLEKENSSSSNVNVQSSVGVGYETGTTIDPVTGLPVRGHGVTTSASTDVSISKDPDPPNGAAHSREVIERELFSKSLPEANVSVPVSGYLYFPIPKSAKDAKYRLEYSTSSEPLILPLP